MQRHDRADIEEDGGGRDVVPIIGVSTYVERARWGAWDRECALLATSYLHAVSGAGGAPVLLPPSTQAAPLVARLDGLVLAGGPDVDARLYGDEPHPEADAARTHRDTWELELLAAAQDQRVPVLGICRGMQLLNVAHGGNLTQHLEPPLDALLHRPRPGTFGRHLVRTSPGSWCRDVLGESAVVPTYHHQAVDVLGHGVCAVAWSADGCVEAIEVEGTVLQLGVQWHPEEEDDFSMIIAGFVDSCRRQQPTQPYGGVSLGVVAT